MKRLLSYGLFAALVQQTLGATTVITGVRVEVGDGKILPSASIVITDTKITAVGENIEIPTGATLIDGKGLTAYPGFFDAYSNSGLKIPEQKPYGSPPDSRTTAPATMWHENRKGIRPDVSAAKCLDLKGPFTDKWKQGITTVLVSPDGGCLSGTSAIIDYVTKPSVVAPDVASDLVFRNASGSGYPGTLFGVFALIRQTLSDAKSYSGIKKDPAYEALQPAVKGMIPFITKASTARDIVRANRIADEFGLKLILNGGTEGYRVTDLIKSKGQAVILSLDVTDAPDQKVEDGPDATPKEVLADKLATWKERSVNAKKLSEAGIELAFTTSGMLEGYLPGLRKLVTNGLPREAALKGLSYVPSRLFGVSDKLGTIEAGKLANIVLMNGDFLDAKAVVKIVFTEGEKFETKETGK